MWPPALSWPGHTGLTKSHLGTLAVALLLECLSCLVRQALFSVTSPATPPLLPSSRHFLDLHHSTFMSASACVDCLFPSLFTVRVQPCGVPFKEQRPCLFFPLLCSEGPAQASPPGLENSHLSNYKEAPTAPENDRPGQHPPRAGPWGSCSPTPTNTHAPHCSPPAALVRCV